MRESLIRALDLGLGRAGPTTATPARQQPSSAQTSSVPPDLLRPPYGAATTERFRAALAHPDDMAQFIRFVAGSLLTRDHQTVFFGDRMLTLDKSAGFLDDPAFKAAFGSIHGSHDYDQYGGAQTIAWRLHTLIWAAQSALALPAGDFVECGVFKGDMAWMVGQVTNFAATGRQFWLFDSFSGFDPSQATDGDFPDNPGFVALANAVYGKDGLYESVVARFQGLPWYQVHRGFLPAKLDEVGFPDRIAFLHIDLNSPAAEVGCLERMFDHVVPGGYVVFDDYGWKPFRAQKEAEDSFFAARGYRVLELPTGQGLVIKR
jgi:hypothetical protein